MQTELPHPLLSRLSELVRMQMGLYFPANRWGDLERGIMAAAPALGLGKPDECVRRLLSTSLTRRQIEIIASCLTVGETYFFREKKSFDALEERVFPELLNTCARLARPLRIWSAGCSTGEEPYSIAMLLDRLIHHTGEWNATILATDINPVFLQKAAEGLYGEWSFRATPAWIKERYFKPRKNGQFEISPHIRKRVTFSYLNLADDVYPSLTNGTNAMDVIFCRNVLMYFNPEWVKKIGQKFHRSLLNGGWLVLSPIEVSSSLFPQFKATPFSGAILYQKNEAIENAEQQINDSGYPASTLTALSDRSFKSAPESALGQAHASSLQEVGRSYLPEARPQALPVLMEKHVGNRPANSDAIDTLCQTARFHANLGKLTEAVDWCEKAITIDKLNPIPHYLLATIRQELGQSEAAMQSLMRTLYLDPDFVLAHFTLGNLYLMQGRRREAERHFDTALSLLHMHPHDEPIPESDGLTAGRLTEIITTVRSIRAHATPRA